MARAAERSRPLTMASLRFARSLSERWLTSLSFPSIRKNPPLLGGSFVGFYTKPLPERHADKQHDKTGQKYEVETHGGRARGDFDFGLGIAARVHERR